VRNGELVKRYLALGDEQLMADELERADIDLERQAEVTPTTIAQAMQSVAFGLTQGGMLMSSMSSPLLYANPTRLSPAVVSIVNFPPA
jgi:hypothetical protein